MKNPYSLIYILRIIIFVNIFFISNICFSQTEFTITAGCNLCNSEKGKALLNYINNEKIYIIRDSCLTTTDIKVGKEKVFFGNIPKQLNNDLSEIFKGWFSCKKNIDSLENVDPGEPIKSSIFAPFYYIPERIVSQWQIGTTFNFETKKIFSLDYYVNPYLQAFGGDPLGIPFSYGNGVGMVIGFGTPYSGPFETDFVKGGLHLALFEVSVTSRIKEFVLKYSANTNKTVDLPNTWLGNWNNIFTPHLGIEFALEIPAVRISYFATLDTLQDVTDNPIIVYNEVTGVPMKNNVVREEHFGFEIRTPNLIFYNSRDAKFYFARQFSEYHLGFVGREMKIDNFIFDFRMDATFPGKRDFQLLTELYMDNIWPGFANKAFGFGPSLRLGSTPFNNFGIISAFVNFRLKVGDFFDNNLYD